MDKWRLSPQLPVTPPINNDDKPVSPTKAARSSIICLSASDGEMTSHGGLTMSSKPAPVNIMHMPPGVADMNEGYGHGLDFSGEAMLYAHRLKRCI